MDDLVVDCATRASRLVPLSSDAIAAIDAVRVAAAAEQATRDGQDVVRLDLHGRARQALVDNAAFLAVATPTNTQVLAQVRRLTRQHNAVIRLLLAADGARDLLVDSTDV